MFSYEFCNILQSTFLMEHAFRVYFPTRWNSGTIFGNPKRFLKKLFSNLLSRHVAEWLATWVQGNQGFSVRVQPLAMRGGNLPAVISQPVKRIELIVRR